MAGIFSVKHRFYGLLIQQVTKAKVDKQIIEEIYFGLSIIWCRICNVEKHCSYCSGKHFYV